MTTLTEFRAAVVEQITAVLPALPLHPVIPEDVAEVPCSVVGLPSMAPGANTAIADLALDVYVVGRRVDAGGVEDELLGWSDSLIGALGGASRVVSSQGVQIHIVDSQPRVVTIAGKQYLSMVHTVTASTVTC